MKYLALLVAGLSGCAALNKPLPPAVVEGISTLGEFAASVGLTPAGVTPAAIAMLVLNKIRNTTSPARVAASEKVNAA